MTMIKYNGVINSKMPNVGTTIFTVMSKLSQEHNAINLSQGFPDFSCSEKLISLVNEKMRQGFNQYAPMQGAMALRERISEMAEEIYGTSYSPDTEITITAGGTQAIYTAISAFIREGDEVIVFEPAYDCYVPAIEINGGKPVYVQLRQPNFSVDWQMVKKLVNHRTRMIVINTPHNPSGSVFSENDLKELEKITRDTDIIVLSDEVYEHMFFTGAKHYGVARSKSLAERSVLISSFGKTVHTTGWKIGYMAAPANLTTELRKVHQFMVFACNHPVQLAMAEFLKEKDNYLEVKNFYRQKRDHFCKLISGSRFSFEPSAGTYFQLLKYDSITNEKDTDFAIRMTKELGVASVPLSVFYHEQEDNKLLRFCFAKKDETLEKAAEILCRM